MCWIVFIVLKLSKELVLSKNSKSLSILIFAVKFVLMYSFVRLVTQAINGIFGLL